MRSSRSSITYVPTRLWTGTQIGEPAVIRLATTCRRETPKHMDGFNNRSSRRWRTWLGKAGRRHADNNLLCLRDHTICHRVARRSKE
jgi:hypothetical protein